jgi:hypothetical protein
VTFNERPDLDSYRWGRWLSPNRWVAEVCEPDEDGVMNWVSAQGWTRSHAERRLIRAVFVYRRDVAVARLYN